MILPDEFKLADVYTAKKRAEQLGCLARLSHSTLPEAVREIQRVEGNQPCYGGIEPLRHQADTPWRCAQLDCAWVSLCDLTRMAAHAKLASAKTTSFGHLDTQVPDTIRTGLDFRGSPKPGASSVPVALGLRSFQSALSVSRRMLIASPQTMVNEVFSGGEPYRAYVLSDRNASYDGLAGPMVAGQYQGWYCLRFLFTHDLDGLASWLSQVGSFAESGILAYSPRLETIVYPIDLREQTIRVYPSKLSGQVEPTHVAVPGGDILVSDPNMIPILNLELPVLESVDLPILHRLMEDNPEELTAFRRLLRDSADELCTSAIGSSQFNTDLRRIERRIEGELRQLQSDMKSIKLRSTFAVSGCAVAIWTLALFCIVRGEHDVLKMIGPGGSVLALANAYGAYLESRLKLKDNPVYFLWQIGKTRRG